MNHARPIPRLSPRATRRHHVMARHHSGLAAGSSTTGARLSRSASMLVFAALLLLGLTPAHAQLATTSGLTIEDSPTLGAGNTEFSMVYSDCVPDGSFGIIIAPGTDYSMRWQSFALGAVVGLADGVDLLAETHYCINSRSGPASARVEGPGDLRTGVKAALWSSRERNETTLAWIGALGIPLRRAHDDEELSPASSAMGMDQLLVLSHAAMRYAGTLQAGVHYGYDTGEGTQTLLHVAAGGGYQVSSRIQPRIEMHAEQSLRGGSPAISATAGAVVTLAEHLRLDLGLQIATVGETAWRERTLVIRLVFAP